jgi:hypothetical protein
MSGAAVDWTAASPAKAPPLAAGPRSTRFRFAEACLAVAACLATSRMAGEVSNATALLNLGLRLALVARGAPWAMPTGAVTTRPVTSSSGTSQRARLVRIRTPTMTPFTGRLRTRRPLPHKRGVQTRPNPPARATREDLGVTAPSDLDPVRRGVVKVRVRNIGTRPGREVVQIQPRPHRAGVFHLTVGRSLGDQRLTTQIAVAATNGNSYPLHAPQAGRRPLPGAIRPALRRGRAGSITTLW